MGGDEVQGRFASLGKSRQVGGDEVQGRFSRLGKVSSNYDYVLQHVRHTIQSVSESESDSE